VRYVTEALIGPLIRFRVNESSRDRAVIGRVEGPAVCATPRPDPGPDPAISDDSVPATMICADDSRHFS
jgi:hypothetical protein